MMGHLDFLSLADASHPERPLRVVPEGHVLAEGYRCYSRQPLLDVHA